MLTCKMQWSFGLQNGGHLFCKPDRPTHHLAQLQLMWPEICVRLRDIRNLRNLCPLVVLQAGGGDRVAGKNNSICRPRRPGRRPGHPFSQKGGTNFQADLHRSSVLPGGWACSQCKVPELVPMAIPDAQSLDAQPLEHHAAYVIFDLDGTLLDTESLVEEVLEIVVTSYGKEWDGPRGAGNRLGKRPLEAAASVVEEFDLPCTPQNLYNQIITLLQDRWQRTRPLPGAIRLVKHLHSHGIPVAIASSSPAQIIKTKLSYQTGWTDYFPVIVAGDMVQNGKPAPDIFLEAAKRLNADASKCLVIEDSPAGVVAGKAAGMQVVAVPSLPSKAARPLYSSADVICSSLLDFQPQLWGLPPLHDRIGGALPMEPWYMGGPVIKGFGRGSKVLGIPTANLPTSAFARHLAEHVCGIYIGWAGLSNRGVYKMVMSVGWNPYFDNSQKTVEPWILHDFSEDFYGEELRLIVVGYIRPEANFTTLDDLVEKIHEDGRIAAAALDMKPFLDFAQDGYLTTPLPASTQV